MTNRHAVSAFSVLIIDRSTEDAQRLFELLGQSDQIRTVQRATDTETGLAYFKSHQPDCIVLDYQSCMENISSLISVLKSKISSDVAILVYASDDELIQAENLTTLDVSYLSKNSLSAFMVVSTLRLAVERRDLQHQLNVEKQQHYEFLKILAHDIRVPYRHIRQSAQLLADDIQEGRLNQIAELLTMQRKAVDVADSMIESLLIYSRLAKITGYTAVAIDVVLDELAADMSLEENSKFERVGPYPMVKGSQLELKILFQNLIENGLKFNESQNPTVSISVKSEESTMVTLCIEDNGLGMSEKLQATAFDPFTHYDKRGDRTDVGLGLTICKKIVHRLEGDIRCESALGEGSKIFVKLPLS